MIAAVLQVDPIEQETGIAPLDEEQEVELEAAISAGQGQGVDFSMT